MSNEKPARLPSRKLRSPSRWRREPIPPGDRAGWITVLFALPEEARPFHKRLQSFPASAHVSSTCSGAGTSAAALDADYVAEVAAPGDIILICGFAGGLASGLAPGSLIVAASVTDSLSGENFTADSELLQAAESVSLSGLSVRRGTLITGDRVLITAGEKRSFAEQTGGMAVDMETAGAARVAQQYGVPWLAIRAITDGVEDEMPLDFNTLADRSGNIPRGRILLAALTHPWKIPALIQLGKRSALAAENLAVFLEALLKHLPEQRS
jgi:adenosylhomocysteine nucleosidase